MINFPDGELLDLLPSEMKNDTDMICLSYALKMAVGRLLEYERMTMTANFVDELPEKILDVLAVELRSPYYLQSMAIDVKRRIIKNTLVWHTKAGTPSAVSEMVETIFGVGEVVEWQNYTEAPYTPGTFDIVTSAQMTEDIVDYFMQVIERVKNERSHIRRILIERSIDWHEYAATGVISSPRIPITNHEQGRKRNLEMPESVAVGTIASPKEGITNNGGSKNRSAVRKDYAAAAVVSAPHETIGNSAAPATRSLSGTQTHAMAVIASPKVVILNGNSNTSSAIKSAKKAAVGAVSSPHITI